MKTREAVLTALETQAVISKPRPNPRIRRFLTAVHSRFVTVLPRSRQAYFPHISGAISANWVGLDLGPRFAGRAGLASMALTYDEGFGR
jgi:hypothetical protein